MSVESAQIELPSQFKLAALADLHKKVSDVVLAGSALHFDGSLVERVDTAALQFLVMCQRAQSSSDTLLVSGASESLIEGVRDLGLDGAVAMVAKPEQAVAPDIDTSGA